LKGRERRRSSGPSDRRRKITSEVERKGKGLHPGPATRAEEDGNKIRPLLF
jgi:hypothetical protein